ncbi:MAG: hypothetical protein ACKVOW_10325 [Chitinophagaceae bacterium]
MEQVNIKGNVTKLVTETYNVDSLGELGKLESVTIEIFDELGYTIIDTTKNFIEKSEVVEFLIFNKNGSLSSSSTYENGKKQSKMLLKYESSKCIAIEIYDSKDKLESYHNNIQQTEFGLLLSMNSYDKKGKLTMSHKNGYDSIYQISAASKDSSGVLVSEFKINLTENNYPENMLEISYYKDSTIKKYLSYKYEIWDKAGNWIQQTIFNDNGKPVKMVKRIFSYHH